MKSNVARALTRAGGAACALSLLALVVGFGALSLTSDPDRTPPSAAPSAASVAAAAEARTALAASRARLLSVTTPAALRARPPAEPEALTRVAPPRGQVDVHALAQELSVDAPPLPPLKVGEQVEVSVSFYYCEHSEGTPRGDGGGFCGVMRDGSVVYTGAAACDYSYAGQIFRIDGDPTERIYRCADTGSAVAGLHRDIWFATSAEGWTWQRQIGKTATIEILP